MGIFVGIGNYIGRVRQIGDGGTAGLGRFDSNNGVGSVLSHVGFRTLNRITQ